MIYKRIIIVAHPDDETLKFSSVLNDALVVCVTDGNSLGRGCQRKREFNDACNALGASRSIMFDIPDVYPHRLPERLIANKLRRLELSPEIEVYTHSPFDDHPHHRSVTYASSLVFPILNVEALSARPSEVNILTDTAFSKKLKVVNSTYTLEIRPLNEAYVMPSESVMAVESFSRVTSLEIMRALALTQPEIKSEQPDVWGFSTSPYEIERMKMTVQVMAEAFANSEPPNKILELGACEGIMTSYLSNTFPQSNITAVEPNPQFARRLADMSKHYGNINLVEASALSISIDSDVVIIAEMLYYLKDSITLLLSNIKSNWLVTSYYGQFDVDVNKLLLGFGWQQVANAAVSPCFEPVDGANSRLIIRRAGTNIRIWRST